MLTLSGRCVTYERRSWTPPASPDRPNPREFVDHLLTVATESGLVTVRVPEAHVAAMNGGLELLRQFGQPVVIDCKPVIRREFGQPVPAVEPVAAIQVVTEAGELAPVG
jgi:hypothetical protein